MKKTIIKASLLVVAILLSIYGVLHWKHTVVDPPKQLEFDNSHLVDLSKSISKVSIDSLEIGYQECQYKLRRYQKEELINQQEATTKLEDLVGIYTPYFITKSKTAFSNSVWDKKSWSHSFMIKRIEELKNLTRYDGNKIIDATSTYITDMNDINAIIKKYNDAWELSNWTRFRSISTTKERVSQANTYKNDTYLKNCTKLVEALNELPSKIRKNHLNYLTNLASDLYCSNLDDYHRFNEELKDIYNVKIEAYDNYYSSSHTSDIKKSLRDKQYSYLKNYSDYALDVFHFDTWEAYKVMNEKVYDFLSNYVGVDSRMSDLKESHMKDFKMKEEDFNSIRFPQTTEPTFGIR